MFVRQEKGRAAAGHEHGRGYDDCWEDAPGQHARVRALVHLGRFDDAVSLATETLWTAEAVDAVWPFTVASAPFAEAMVARGEIGAAVPHVERGRDKALARELSAVIGTSSPGR